MLLNTNQLSPITITYFVQSYLAAERRKRAVKYGIVASGIVGFLMGLSGLPVDWYTPIVGLITFYSVKTIASR